MTEYELITSVPKDWYDLFEDNIKIIRCKNCKWYQEQIVGHCDYWEIDRVKEDEYCSRAERKESCTNVFTVEDEQ